MRDMGTIRFDITTAVKDFLDNSLKAVNGNKSAGARSRKATLKLEKLFKEWRKASVPCEVPEDATAE